MNKLKLGVAVLLLGSASVQAQGVDQPEKRSFSRSEAEAYALENSYDMQRYALELDKAKAIIYQNVAIGLPQVNATADFTDNIDIPQQVIEMGGQPQLLSFGVQYGSSVGLSVGQLIFDGSYVVALMATEVVKENANNSFEKSAIETREQVAQAYHLVLITNRSLEILRENLKFIEQSLTETRAMLEAGFVEQQDVDQLDLLVTNLKSNIDYLERQSEVASTVLKLRMGIPINETVTLTDDVEGLMLLAEDGAALIGEEFDPTQHIDYRTIQTGIRGQELTVRNEQVQYLPRLSGYYSYNHQFQSPELDALYNTSNDASFDFAVSSWGLQLNWSIFQSGGRMAKIQEAKIELDQLMIQERQLTDMLTVQFQTSRAEYAYAVNNYMAQRKNVEIAKGIRNRTAIKFEEGVASSLEFTQAEQQYQDALRSLISAAQTALDKRVALEKVLGKFNLDQQSSQNN